MFGQTILQSDLEDLLTKARREGKANPSIIDQFNEEVTQARETENIDWDAVSANDGAAPGGECTARLGAAMDGVLR
jgi:hypothetical protein